MAIFNPDVPEPKETTPKWGKESSPISQVDANKSTGIALSGFGDALQMAGQGLDLIVKDKINKEVWDKVDAERQAYTDALEGANAAASADPTKNSRLLETPKDSKAVPKNIDRVTDYLQTIKNGMEAGKVNDTYYKSRMNAIVKDLRATYPGYRDYIDQKVSSITGFNPANSLVSDLLSDINTIAAQSAKGDASKQLTTSMLGKLKDTFMSRETDAETAKQARIIYLNLANGRIDLNEAVRQTGDMNKTQHEVNENKLRWELVNTNNALGIDAATKHFDAEASRLVSNLTTNVTVDGKVWDWNSTREALAKWRRGEEVYPAEAVTAMGNMLENQEVEMREKLRQLSLKPNSKGKNLSEIMTPDTVNQRIDAHVKFISEFRKNIRENNLPMAMATAQAVKDMKDDAARRLMAQKELRPFLEARGALDVYFPNSPFLTKIAETSTAHQFLGPLTSWMNQTDQNAALNKVAPKDPNNPATFNATIEQAKRVEVPAPVAADEALKMTTRIIDPEVPNEAKAGYIQYFFDTKNMKVLDNFNRDTQDATGKNKPGQFSIYNSLTSPGIVNEAKRVADATNDPALWEMVKNWTIQNFNEQAGRDLRSLAGIHLPLGAGITYQDKTNQFVLLYKGKDITNVLQEQNRILVDPATGNTFPSNALYEAQRSIVRINHGLVNLNTVAKNDNISNPAHFIMNAMIASGLKPNQGTPISYPDHMIRAISTYSLRNQMEEELRMR